MNVKKFSANTSRDALRLVRDALGSDAVILSNRTVNGVVEILALASEDMSSLAAPAVEKEALPESVLAAFAARRKTESEQASGLAQALDAARNNGTAASARDAGRDSREEMAQMMNEIRSMRGMLETQLAELSWNNQQQREPAKATVMREMLAAGFSASLARYLIEKMPESEKAQRGMSWIKTILTRNLATVGNENEILEKGGVFALVGPTGVGKTTTTAKLAARCVMHHGAGKLALITTDGYRIGGYEQLRIYGKILGVMVHSVKDEADLRIALDELKNKHTVLIDTAGVGQRDQMVAEQVAMLSGADTPVKRLLCLNATSTGETLNEVVRAYMGNGLAGCIMTKLDEAATIGSVLDVVIRQKLNLYYVANGQRVPEDLHIANQQYLVDRAFKLKRETAPFRYQDEELPLVMANTARAMNDKSLREVILG
jgi:flagellar biosynthesis protein FlhF